MSTLTFNPEFTSGAPDQVKSLLEKEYPVNVRDGVPYIPGQYMARILFPVSKPPIAPLPKVPKWVDELHNSQPITFQNLYRLLPDNTREFIPGKLIIRPLQLCRCCETPLFLLGLTLEGASVNVEQLLADAVLITPGGDDPAQGTAVTISPGPDGTAQNTSLEIISQDQYTFIAAPHQPNPGPPIDADESVNKSKPAPKAVNLTPDELARNYGPFNANLNKAVRIAIIDTGFKRTLMEGPIQNQVAIWDKTGSSSCGLINDRVGWNFVGKGTLRELITATRQGNGGYRVSATGQIENSFEDNHPEDNSPIEHGTLLAGLITHHAGNVPTALMILKAFDSEGKGSLFAVICAFCYAQANGADIVNASFIAHQSRGTDYLRVTISDLRKKGIIVVCAAGNRGSGSDSRGQLLTGQFYPACFSREFKNVITTTSVWGTDENQQYGLLSPGNAENYSPEYVNVGLLTNHPDRANEGYFTAPYLWYRDTLNRRPAQHPLRLRWPGAGVGGVVGSSFATGILAGLVAHVLDHHQGVRQLIGAGSDFSASDPRSAVLSQIEPVGRESVGLIVDNFYVDLL